MKSLKLFTASALALGLAACGNAGDTAPGARGPADTPRDRMEAERPLDHGDHDMGVVKEGVGHATGVIRSIGSGGDFLTVEHGPFEGIGMGAMTMGFDVMGDVDLSGFAAGDEVAFMVKQGRDGSYRVMAICNTATEGAGCLDGGMDD